MRSICIFLEMTSININIKLFWYLRFKLMKHFWISGFVVFVSTAK